MPNYRRIRAPGGTYFFTLCLHDSGSALLRKYVDEFRSAYAATVIEMPVKCRAIVVLPDHLHAIWTLPEGDSNYQERWRRIKSRFTRAVAPKVGGSPTLPASSRSRKREREIWQRRYWEHLIRDQQDLALHMNYCWTNPVKHGLVRQPTDWPHSSIHREIRLGHVEPGRSFPHIDGNFGE